MSVNYFLVCRQHRQHIDLCVVGLGHFSIGGEGSRGEIKAKDNLKSFLMDHGDEELTVVNEHRIDREESLDVELDLPYEEPR